MRRYFICKNTFDSSVLRSFAPINNILDWNCFSIEEEEAKLLPGYAVEIDKEMAIFGMRSWGDIRSTIKISSADVELNTEFDVLSYYDTSMSSKIAIPMTDKRYNTVLKTMKLFAKVIIEDTFETRFKSLDDGVSELEKKNWDYISEDLNNGTDFILSELAGAKGITVEKLKDSILEKKESYRLATKELFINMNSLKQQFYRCSTIRQLNRLYEDKMGIPMPYEQAKDEKRIDEQTRSQNPVAPGIKF